MASERRRRQVARQIQERIAELLLYEMKDPRSSFVTITGVEVNIDLTVARIRYTVLEAASRSKVEHMLEHAHGFLRTEVARAIKLRSAPQVIFEYDQSIELAARIDSILDRVIPPGERAEVGPEDEA